MTTGNPIQDSRDAGDEIRDRMRAESDAINAARKATLTRDEAEAAARKGAKVRREGWPQNDWVTICDGITVDETGSPMTNGYWRLVPADGWSIVEPAAAPAPVEPDLAARVESLEGIVNVLAGESRSASDLEQAYNAAKAAGKFDAPTFRTSRKPAPGVMTKNEIIAEAMKAGENWGWLGVAEKTYRLTRQSVREQLAANEDRAVKAGLEVWGERAFVRESPEKAIRAALAAIREGL